ncbi:hypothetical protein [Inhella sp.]|uniref:hypothetical protein n=1 Tax=Inhella sp. TaxID=1921806 RepID=UPI0035B05144
MHQRLRPLLILLALCINLDAWAQPFNTPDASTVISALFPGKSLFEWARSSGDFNEDGFGDLALIVTLSADGTPMQTRLVVLAGSAAGTLTALSVSSNYCEAQKFFNLSAKGSNLLVSAVQTADANQMASETLQFHFSRRLGDFELIGREDSWESYADNRSGRVSVNYLTGNTVEYAQVRGRTKEIRRQKFATAPLARLNGFDCAQWLAGNPK